MIQYLELLVEEESMKFFLREMLRRFFPALNYSIHPFQGKTNMLKQLPSRFRAYAKMQHKFKIIVLIDRDNDDCKKLKARIEAMARQSGLLVKSASNPENWQVTVRIAVEELEAWYFGDWEALMACYSKVPPSIPNKKQFRDPDAIQGGTWEQLEKIMKSRGYYQGGLPKREIAKNLGSALDPSRNRSQSFQVFWRTVEALSKH